ncbi:hypothetical protein LBMAG45_17620 [Nitrospirota bacterium]|nr:hypothetical protein LBMAG45_17620 [Nitrospirota bacterium]
MVMNRLAGAADKPQAIIARGDLLSDRRGAHAAIIHRLVTGDPHRMTSETKTVRASREAL